MTASDTQTLYDTLKIHSTASQADIKAAYHRALLTSHPDKRRRAPFTEEKAFEARPDFDIAALKEAYLTLCDPETRAAYDASLSASHRLGFERGGGAGPRPAQIISFDDFVEASSSPSNHVYLMRDNESVSSYVSGSSTSAHEKSNILRWTHECRCGGEYSISEEDLEEDRHLIACERCSEVVYVGYEVVEEL